jgi:hypothetical protein
VVQRRRVNLIVMRLSVLIKAAAVLLWLPGSLAIAQEPKLVDYSHVKITLTSEGGPSGCVIFEGGRPVDCIPKYSVTIDENGTVIFHRISSVKPRDERVHSIPISTVRALVSEFQRIDFFSLDDRYEVKKLPNGHFQTIDHGHSWTVSIDIDGKSKSIYIFFGEPDDLAVLVKKIVDTTQISQSVGSP